MRIKSNVASIDETPKEHWNYLFVATFELLSLHLWPLPINERIALIRLLFIKLVRLLKFGPCGPCAQILLWVVFLCDREQ